MTYVIIGIELGLAFELGAVLFQLLRRRRQRRRLEVLTYGMVLERRTKRRKEQSCPVHNDWKEETL